MLTRRPYLFLVLAAMLFFAGCSNDEGGGASRKMPDLRESYSHKDKKPFGTFLAYRQLEEMFYRNNVRDEKRNFEDSWKFIGDTNCVYINISQSLYTTDEDVDAIMSFVKEGNDAFFAVQQFDENLLQKLDCKTTWTSPDTYNFALKPYRTTGVRMKEEGVGDGPLYQYFYVPFGYHFASYNSANTRVLGVNQYGQPDFLVVFKGKGRIFVHCDPRAFTNYFLLQKNNYEYLQKAFGYLRAYPDHVYWNNYYVTIRSREQAESRRNNRSGDDESFSSVSEIMKHPPLKAAFWLTLLLLALYILFTMKRRQRIVEMVKPNENTTVTFTETIGRLYLQKKDNKNIADKMITYLNEHIRNKYFLNTNVVNKEFMSTLSRKSGVPYENVETLYRAIQHAHQNPELNDYQLLSLNEQIQGFYKKSE